MKMKANAQSETDPVPPSSKRQCGNHPNDLPPYSDDMFSHLTGEDIPDITTDDLMFGNDAELP